MTKRIRALALAALLAGTPAAHAVDGFTLELGHNDDENADRYGLAVQWEWESRWFTAGDWYLGGYWELGVSHWDGDRGRTGNDSLTEAGITPVFRLQPHQPTAGGLRPYLELGIGAHLLSDLSIGDKRFGTSFNFGDHLGVGARFGDRGQYELMYRFQHLSNAGIEKPNPGINFHLVQLKYWY